MLKRGKKGQVTIFIILAIVIVALAVLIYVFFPQIKTTIGISTENPEVYLQTCIEDKLETTIEKISLQGGSVSPTNYIAYQNSNIEYLCYINEYYEPCVMQQPFLQTHIESEIRTEIVQDVRNCFDSMRQDFEEKGYGFNLRTGTINVELLPERVIVNVGHILTLTKDSSDTYETFRIVSYNNLYELVSITNSILNWETNFGSAETTTYMDYYPHLKVEKKNQQDGSTIYIITDRNKGDFFQFASRSYAWPPGYGYE
jgi:hypothetical protein